MRLSTSTNIPFYFLFFFLALVFVIYGQESSPKKKPNDVPSIKKSKDPAKAPQESSENEIYRARIIVDGEVRRIISQSVVKQEVIDAKTIREQGATNAAQALEFQSGLELQSEIRGQSVRLQGLNPEHALILINGERLIGALAGNINLQRIKSEEIERIEITKGASSALYGSSAIGGVINIITKKAQYPLEVTFDASLGVVGTPFRLGEVDFYQDANETHQNLSISTSEEKVKNSFTFGAHQATIIDLDGVFPNTNIPEAQDLNFSHRLVGNVGKQWYVRSELSYRKLLQRQIDFSAPRTIFDRVNKTDDFGYALGAKKYFGKNNRGELDLSAYFARYHDDVAVDQHGSDELDRRDFNEERLQTGRIAAKIPTLPNNTLTLGGEFQLEELLSLRTESGYVDRENSALFLQNESNFLVGRVKWYIVPGLRYEGDTFFGQALSPKLAFRWAFANSLNIRLSVGDGFRRPTLRNLFLQFQNPGVGYQVIGNPELLPETSTSYNLDFSFRPNSRSSISFNFYYNDLKNLIEFVRLPGFTDGFTTYQVRNLASTYTRGFEFFGQWILGKNFRLRLGYNYGEAFDRTQNIFLEGRSLHHFIYGFSVFKKRHEFHFNGVIYSAQAVYQRSEEDNPGLIAFANVLTEVETVLFRYPRHIINLRYSYQVSPLYQVYLGMDNVLDQYDIVLNPVRPRYTYIGLKIEYDKKQ